MLTRYFISILICAAATAAQAITPPVERRPPPSPRMILSDNAAQPIQLRQLDINAEISGGMAQTTVRMVFFNPNRRQLEGNLQFPLAEGQQVTAFALDINGVMRPAVPVDKARGRMVFEAIERRQVDPGLLEVTQGNNFKLRVYPIMAHGIRTVELTYAEPLGRRGANWAYRLPLAYGDVQDMNLRVRVNDSSAQPAARGAPLSFKSVQNGYEAQLERGKHTASGAIEIVTVAQAEPRVYRQELNDATWFVAEIPVRSTSTPRAAPHVVGLLWDSSGSGSARDLDAELAELDRYFSALGNVEVRLTRLRDRPETQQVFRVEHGDWRLLRRVLEKTVYDGASALGDWRPQASIDQYLLFSDGLSNYGSAAFPQLAPHQRLFALNSALSADTGRLAALAERHLGQLIQVNASTPGAAAQALLFEEARVDDITATGAADIEVDSYTVRDGMLRAAGRLLSPQAELTLTVTNGGKTGTMRVPLPANAAEHPSAAATWARFRLRALEADFELHRGEIGRIGRRFGIPTRETSLIVLEQMDDYVRYDIEPPAQLVAEYKQLKKHHAHLRAGEREKHIDQVVRMFEQRRQWWNTPFPQRKEKPAYLHRAPAKGGVIADQVMMAPPPVAEAFAPSPAPAAAAEMRMALQGSAKERVEITGSALKRAASPTRGIGIELKKWVPNAPYMERMNQAPADKVYQVYLDQKPDYANSSAFFLDAADILLAKGQRELALRVLSNLAEMDLDNRAVLRILGYRLMQAGEPLLAVPVFENVKRIAVEEPQSFRDLGLALAAAGKPQEAVDTLYEVVLRPWDHRFPDIEIITLADLNAIVATSSKQLDLSRVDRRLLANLPLDLRVVMTWDADNSDMDLHVTDPNGEQSYYAHKLTSQGGRMSNDFTGGYGPEEFALRRAKPGKYQIHAKFYGNRQQVIAGATTVQVKLFSGFGTSRQKEQMMTLRLKDRSEMVFVGEFEVKR